VARPSGSIYDSFVVRLWRDPVTRLVRRAEVSHVQSGEVRRERGAEIEWVLQALRDCLQGLPLVRATSKLGSGAHEPPKQSEEGVHLFEFDGK
jgi:hypothetical protein